MKHTYVNTTFVEVDAESPEQAKELVCQGIGDQTGQSEFKDVAEVLGVVDKDPDALFLY